MLANIIHFDLRGDFYIAFHQDARDAANLLELAIVELGGAESIGIPRHGIEGAISTLTEKGFAVKFNKQI